MKTYWDSSALIEIIEEPSQREGLDPAHDCTRLHSLVEIFSTLTKGVNFRYGADDAARIISDFADDLELVELSKVDVLAATKAARRAGVRGARIHDFMHAAAARKSGARVLKTLDTAGFSGLGDGLKIVAP
jgi:predicted nucleic acid-binding protein